MYGYYFSPSITITYIKKLAFLFILWITDSFYTWRLLFISFSPVLESYINIHPSNNEYNLPVGEDV